MFSQRHCWGAWFQYHSIQLSDEMITAISTLQLGRIEQRIQENYGIPFNHDKAYNEKGVKS